MTRRDQNLAVVSWQLVDTVPAPARSDFRSRAVSLGPMLVGSGLAATAAFHEAKAGPGRPAKPLEQAYRILVDALARHVLATPGADGKALVLGVGAMDIAEYRRASADARAFALWVRRAAEALIPRAGAGQDTEERGIAGQDTTGRDSAGRTGARR
ncbi:MULTISPECIES: type III-B CRISPR module-associated protein Cmr5 [Protofrankia]|uniref:CRISPR type III-B/RAMP module-associated protein Cmr5 n=1 Tax=Protofrankia coriariae TaxID=1562887 RepID=A0ABR5F8H2_9ACTN|nr:MULTISPECIES: type III-B CRISPR module-associated protein Cmr5 [Protofrankia]KLL13029.1 hypothetical protein FrCorBMG51_00315 [Protofrankia coriariae]ONH38296.1 type III-B CRISPR module-associated protein Cmr5 [Protofrankia sp. BMG5.30]